MTNGSRTFATTVGAYTLNANQLSECARSGADPQRLAENLARLAKRLPVRGPGRMSTGSADPHPRVRRTKDGREIVTNAMTVEVTPKGAGG